MFDISWGKLIIIGVVALIVIGPKELPGVLRMLGQYMGKMRRMASEFQGQFQEAMREAEMADLKKQFDDTTSSFQTSLDPTGFNTDIEKMIQDPAAPLASATATPSTPPSDPAASVTTPAPATPHATPPSDPAAPAQTVDVSVPMPELPPPVETKDFAPPSTAPTAEPAPATPTPAAEGGKAA